MSNKDTSINPPWACLTSSPEIFRSFETVINMGLQHQQHQRHHQQHPEEARHDVGEERRWATRENLVSADSEDNTEEENGVDDGARPPPCRTAWGEVGGDKRRLRGVSRTSSGSTSDDDKRGGSGAGAKGGGSDGGGTGGGARSTLESTGQIDRAKSFEYFPGEEFRMQENSSSYEYLPGHMVADRPGTVVSNYNRGADDEKDGDDGRVSGVEYISTSSDASFAESKKNQRSARRRIELERTEKRREQERLLDLNAIAEELSDRSKDLLQAHVRKTKHFYKKVKRYIAYASSPSQTPEESRKKQEILDRLLEVMQHQESRLDEERPLSSQLGRITAMSNVSAAVQTTSSLATAATAAAPATASSLSEEEPPSSSTRRIATETIETTTVPTTSTASAKSKKGSKLLSPERVSFHEDKIGQLRALRKEIKRLETLEYEHLGRSPNKSCSSELSSLASTTTTNSTFRSDKIAMPPPSSAPTSKRAMPKTSLQQKQAPSRPKSSSSAKNGNRGGNRYTITERLSFTFSLFPYLLDYLFLTVPTLNYSILGEGL